LADKLNELSKNKYTTAHATQFMKQFFLQFPQVKSFNQQIIESCKSKGYVQTISRRKRFLPDINSDDQQRRNYAQRQAVNTVVQGSASDIVKQAMLKLRLNLSNYFGTSARLVMQIHDEIVVEVTDESILDDVIDLMKECMSCVPGIKNSSVSFPVNIKVGKTLDDLSNYKCQISKEKSDFREIENVAQANTCEMSSRSKESSEKTRFASDSNNTFKDAASDCEPEDIIFDIPSVKQEIAAKLDQFRFA
jgi:hypothetical protein